MEQIETVRVQREKHADNPTGVVIINKSDLQKDDVLAEGEVVEDMPEPVAVTTQDDKPVEAASETPSQPWLRK